MRFENHSDLPAALFRGVLGQTRMLASCALRVTYELRGEELVIADEQPWIVSAGPWESPIGMMCSDELFYRGGVDLFVYGSAWTKGRKPATEAHVEAHCGDFRHRLRVVGDRVWTRQRAGLVASAAAPFVSMPLSMDRTFGGRRPWDGIEVAYPDNPEGRGYYLDEDDAVGQPLPNIEHPDVLLRNWNDQPEPVGFGLTPPQFGPRLRQSLPFNEKHELIELRPTLFNQAFPGMIMPEARPGQEVQLLGVDPEGALRFVLPECPAELRLDVGPTVLKRVPRCDQIGVLVEARRVFISYRFPFRYEIHAQQQRFCRVLRRSMVN